MKKAELLQIIREEILREQADTLPVFVTTRYAHIRSDISSRGSKKTRVKQKDRLIVAKEPIKGFYKVVKPTEGFIAGHWITPLPWEQYQANLAKSTAATDPGGSRITHTAGARG